MLMLATSVLDLVCANGFDSSLNGKPSSSVLPSSSKASDMGNQPTITLAIAGGSNDPAQSHEPGPIHVGCCYYSCPLSESDDGSVDLGPELPAAEIADLKWLVDRHNYPYSRTPVSSPEQEMSNDSRPSTYVAPPDRLLMRRRYFNLKKELESFDNDAFSEVSSSNVDERGKKMDHDALNHKKWPCKKRLMS